MGMAEDIAQIKWTLDHMHNGVQIVQGLDEIKEKLKYDIEPKLDKALEGKTTTEAAPQPSPDDRARQIKYCLLYASTDRKIEAIKAIREATGLGLKEAKEAVEWIQVRLDIVRKEAPAQKEAE